MTNKKYGNLLVQEKKNFWSQNPLIGIIDIEIPSFVTFKMLCENDDSVVKDLHWTNFSGWELTSLKIWKALAQELSAGEVVLDVGAYSGIYSLIACKENPELIAIAFDIQQKCIERINKNIEINGLLNLTSVLGACSSSEGEIDFFFYEEAGILSSVASIVPKKMNDKSSRINSLVLDKFINNRHPEHIVKLVKIDVEGAEQETLKGMRNILQRNSPNMLIEINSKKNVDEVKKIFPHGYKCYSIDDFSGKIKKTGFFFKQFNKSRNFLFTKMSKKDLLKVCQRNGIHF